MTATGSLAALVGGKSNVLVCGSGGVGKTTTSAALAAQAARQTDRRVLVLTVDPARRLGTALGLERGIGDGAQVVDADALVANNAGRRRAGASVRPRGELSVAMLDTKRGWDELVRQHAPDARTRDTILSNALYAQITSRFVQSHDYLAMERLYELHREGRYDLIVVDTPPSRSALDILDAPERMADFFGGRLLRWLTVPYRSRIFTAASKPFYQVADRILGSRFLQDIAEFFVLFGSMEKGFVRRAQQVGALLTSNRTTFIVVSTLEPAPAREAEFLMAELGRRDLPLGALVLNKVLPSWLRDPAAAVAATTIVSEASAFADALPRPGNVQPAAVAHVLAEIGTCHARLRVAADREQAELARLAAAPSITATVPYLDGDVTDLGALAQIGERLWTGDGW